jgi:NAD-dependent SIR2 family protein deacetylase
MARARDTSTVRCGRTRVPAEAIHSLRRSWRDGRLVLFLGAGVSAQYGLPEWDRLLLTLMEGRLASTPGMRDATPAERTALAAWLIARLSTDPVVLARSIKRDIRVREHGEHDAAGAEEHFLEDVRTALYQGGRDPFHERQPATTLDAVGAFIEAGARAHIARVVTFNYDDLLERELMRRRVPHHTVYRSRGPRSPGIRVVHAHGYLPRHDAIPAHDIVLSEDDYHRILGDPDHWSSRAVSATLRDHEGLFIGLSLRDPNLRRLLDATRSAKRPREHWQVQARLAIADEDLPRLTRQFEEELCRQHVPARRARREAKDLLGRLAPVLRKAEALQRETSEALGVKTLWIERFEDLPCVLDRIR